VKTQEFFDTEAPQWSALYEEDPRFHRRYRRITQLLSQLLRNPGRALDAGCGSGVFSRYLSLKGWQVTAFDASPEMIEAAEEIPSNVQYQCSTIEDFASPDASFDAIISFSMIEYVEDDHAAIHKLAKFLKPGGILIVSVPNRSGLLRKLEGIIFGIRTVSRNRIFSNRGEYLKFQKQQYTSFELDFLMRQEGLKKLRGIYLNAGIASPEWLLPIFERRWWAAMYCAAYEKKS